MISKIYREEIKKIAGVWTVVKKIDKKTGCPVCIECDEIISEEEDIENYGLCDYCDAMKRADEVLTTEHPDTKHTLMGGVR